MTTRTWFRLCSALAMTVPVLTGACSAQPEASEGAIQSGTLELPLVSAVNGRTYRLDGALYLYGPTFSYLDLSGDSALLSLPLSTGNYQAYLVGWTLHADDGSGNFVPVVASLVSDNWVPFTVFNGTKTTLSFEFETDGVIVKVGAGSLDVKVDVTETGPLCTPFGSECGAGAWCPSSDLTGMSPACVAAGAAVAGEPCASPFDCAADSSCFDFGAGPVCADLCDVPAFGSDCSPGVACVPAGHDYGVCTPG